MTTQHSFSRCCGAPVRLFGGRRRQCSRCGRTWRIYPRKRGRKRKRFSTQLLARVVLAGQPSHVQRHAYPALTLRGMQKRVRALIHRVGKKPRVQPHLRGRYILLADALWYRLHKEDWTLYLLLLKPVRRNTARLLDPILLSGGESLVNWMEALGTIPPGIACRIVAFVSDHFRAAEQVADSHRWLHQLCHFHLLAALQKRRGKRKKRIHGITVREAIYQSIVRLLHESNRRVERRLWRLLRRPDCPASLRMIGRTFLRTQERYHTYLQHPRLTIPRTTSPVESLGKLMRKRTRHLRNAHAVQEWATAFIRLKKSITCNGRNILKSSTKIRS